MFFSEGPYPITFTGAKAMGKNQENLIFANVKLLESSGMADGPRVGLNK
jgi:hypothetical protein